MRSTRLRHRLRFPTRIALAILVLLAALPLVSAEARFVVRSAWEEGKILRARRPLRELIDDPATPARRRKQFELVLAARAFAADRLGLAAEETYTTFSDVGEGPLLHVLSASPKDRIEDYRWSYPVVGSIPYKGFFDEEAARAEARRLEARGYDTYVRPAGAFSTLGWFNDPLLSTALDDDPVEVVATVIHEIAHNTLWVPGDARFNESYANFVGLRGAELFFAGRGEPGDDGNARRAAALWRDEKRLGVFYAGLEKDLQRLYGSGLPGPERERRRTAVFADASARLAGPLGRELELYSGARLAQAPLNNARVIAKRIYLTGLDELDSLYARKGGNLREGIREIERLLRLNPSRPAREALTLAPRTRAAG